MKTLSFKYTNNGHSFREYFFHDPKNKHRKGGSRIKRYPFRLTSTVMYTFMAKNILFIVRLNSTGNFNGRRILQLIKSD